MTSWLEESAKLGVEQRLAIAEGLIDQLLRDLGEMRKHIHDTNCGHVTSRPMLRREDGRELRPL
jgi:hypothetical protein